MKKSQHHIGAGFLFYSILTPSLIARLLYAQSLGVYNENHTAVKATKSPVSVV